MYFDDWSSNTRILGFDDIACYYFNSLDLDSKEDIKIFYEKEKVTQISIRSLLKFQEIGQIPWEVSSQSSYDLDALKFSCTCIAS